MAHADLFAFTSRWEGLGFVLIEALAVGTPVVSTDCPSGPREILEGGRYGPLVPVDDDAALARPCSRPWSPPAGTTLEAARPYAIEASTDAYLDAMGLPAYAPACRKSVARGVVPDAGGSGTGPASGARVGDNSGPMFTILIPSYNRAYCLPRALR